ncbi:MAG: hypothetical protein CMM52_15875 [Rhodospirillaceae bacterium]|nr:hypothetical protein [Rhodospirillaceae bacterium]
MIIFLKLRGRVGVAQPKPATIDKSYPSRRLGSRFRWQRTSEYLDNHNPEKHIPGVPVGV